MPKEDHKESRGKRKKPSIKNCGENRKNVLQIKKIKIKCDPENDKAPDDYQSVSLNVSVKDNKLNIKPVITPKIKRLSNLKNNGNHRSSSPIRRLTRSRAKQLDERGPTPVIPFPNTIKKEKINLNETYSIEVVKPKKRSYATKQKPKLEPVIKKPQIKTEMKKFVGAHLSITGGLENIIHEAREIGAKAVGLFLKSQRTWKSKPLEDKTVEKFKKACKDDNFPMSKILPHGSYLLNCGSSKADLLSKSRDNLIDDLHRCDRLGIELFNFHPGSTCGEITVSECVSRIAESINIAHKQTDQVTVVIENMSCQGHTIGGKFEELRDIIDQVYDKQRIGVCLDTCHAFAAGFDISTEVGYEQMMTDFENIIGLEYLKAIHLNDSKGDVGCHKDRHENIGKGKIGLDGFRRVMNDLRLNDIPIILETPMTIDDQKEIKMLYAMVE